MQLFVCCFRIWISGVAVKEDASVWQQKFDQIWTIPQRLGKVWHQQTSTNLVNQSCPHCYAIAFETQALRFSWKNNQMFIYVDPTIDSKLEQKSSHEKADKPRWKYVWIILYKRMSKSQSLQKHHGENYPKLPLFLRTKKCDVYLTNKILSFLSTSWWWALFRCSVALSHSRMFIS